MSLRRLLNTSAMRIALRYAGLYAVLMTLGLSVVYWTSGRYVDEQISTGLQQRAIELLRIDQQHGRDALIQTLSAQQSIDYNYPRHYLLQSRTHKKIAGDLSDWPPGFGHYGKVMNVWIDGSLLPAANHEADGYWPMIAEKLPGGGRILLAQSLRQAEELQEVIFYTITMILLGSVGLAVAMGWLTGKTLLARIDRINTTARAIISGDFSQRITRGGQNDEFDELADYLNSMLRKIEQLLTGMRHVTDNIAHDLRKPLSRMRSRLEITLLETRDADEYRRVLRETIDDCDELIRTFNALLEIAQTEAGSFRGEWKTVDLSALLTGLGALYQEHAESQGKHLSTKVPAGLFVAGNRHLLAQAVSNLLDNAIKFCPMDGQITITAERHGAGTVLHIADNGPGIPADAQALVLERFTRLDAARSTPGCGLGLSLVKAVADLHGARLELTGNDPGLKVGLHFMKTG